MECPLWRLHWALVQRYPQIWLPLLKGASKKMVESSFPVEGLQNLGRLSLSAQVCVVHCQNNNMWYKQVIFVILRNHVLWNVRTGDMLITSFIISPSLEFKSRRELRKKKVQVLWGYFSRKTLSDTKQFKRCATKRVQTDVIFSNHIKPILFHSLKIHTSGWRSCELNLSKWIFVASLTHLQIVWPF